MVCIAVATFIALSTGVPRKAHGVRLVTMSLRLGQGRDLPPENPHLDDTAGHWDVSQPLEDALLFVMGIFQPPRALNSTASLGVGVVARVAATTTTSMTFLCY